MTFSFVQSSLISSQHLLAQILHEYTSLESDLHTEFEKLGPTILTHFISSIQTTLTRHASDNNVVGFKSVICYRTGLAIRASLFDGIARGSAENLADLQKIYLELKQTNKIRLEHKSINDLLVCIALMVAAQFNKPGNLSCCIFFIYIFRSSISYWPRRQ